MKGYKKIGVVILGCIFFSMYGIYAYNVIKSGGYIDPLQWILTVIFGVAFLIYRDKTSKA